MYDMNFKNLKKSKDFFLIFGGIGVFAFIFFFITSLILIFNYKNYDASIMSTNVEIIDYINENGKLMYTKKFSYEVDGKVYVCASGTSSSNLPDSNNEIIYYKSNNPSKCLSDDTTSVGYFFLAFTLLPVIFIIIGMVGINKHNKKIKKLKRLNEYGKLVKNLPYRVENSNFSVNDNPLPRIVVEYTLPDGTPAVLYGESRFDNKTMDNDGLVDIVIDESDPTNYFIDFEINRLSGNLDSDYYKSKTSSNN